MAFGAVACAGLVLWLSRSPWSETGILYRGVAPNAEQVFLLLRKEDASTPSELQFSDGRAYWLSASDATAGLAELHPWLNHRAVELGTPVRVALHRTNDVVTLEVGGAEHRRTLNLVRIGRELTLSAKSGWRFRSHGLTSDTEQSVLELSEADAAADALNASRLPDRQQAGDLGGVGWRDVLDGIRHPYAGNAHQYSSRFMPVHLAADAVSLLGVYYEYTGGAHGNTTLLVHNLHFDANGWSEVDLDPLFLDGTEWRARLNARVRGALVSLNASFIENQPSGDETQEVLGQFAVTTAGLVFFFSPYEVASYAEGCFAVFVPFSELAGCLDTNGPLRHFLAK